MERQDRADRPLISLEHVGLSYWIRRSMFRRKAFWALEDISLDLHKGDSLGIIGKNGVGKSTLLGVMAGIMTPDRGTITTLEGTRSSLLSLNLGFINYLSGRENAILGGMFLGMKKRDIKDRLDEIIAFAELEDFIDQPIATYSTGMRARLAFSVAFQIEPDVLLIDEIAGVGDRAFQEKSFAVIDKRVRSQESTVVFVTHVPAFVVQLCNRAIWIEHGTLKKEGDPETVLGAYQEFLRKGN